VSPENHGVLQLLEKVTSGIVPGLRLLLFYSLNGQHCDREVPSGKCLHVNRIDQMS